MNFSEWSLSILWLVATVQGFVIAVVLYRSLMKGVSQALQVGARMPDLRLTNGQGDVVSLRALLEKPTMICVVTKGCPVCERMIPQLDALAATHPSLPIVLVAANTPTEASELRAQTGTRLPMFSASLISINRKLNITRFPYVVWVGDNGVVEQQGVLNRNTSRFWFEEFPVQVSKGLRVTHG